MKVIALVGFSGSGKTTLAELIIAGLCARGYSVGSVKKIHAENFALDTPGTNTDRHRQAGSVQTTALGLQETDILFPRVLGIDELLAHYDQDFVVLEGVRDPRIPALVTANVAEDLARKDPGNICAVAGRLAQGAGAGAVLARPDGLMVPLIDALADPVSLVDFVERAAAAWQ